jgi:hypothetical protein
MFDPRRQSRFAHQLYPVYGRGGSELLVIVLKASFRLSSGRAARPTTSLPIFASDQRLPNGATRYPGDVALTRGGTDVVCLGTAYAPRGEPAQSFEVSLQVGSVSRAARVFGRRLWRRDVRDRRAFAPTPPEKFTSLLLGWEHAFGGVGVAENPVGQGWQGENPAVYEAAELPRIEDPKALVTRPGDRPAPVGFGAIPSHWRPRSLYGGTYDGAWKRTRAPFLPDDFDDRFFQAAAPGLTTATHLKGGEPIRLVNLTRSGLLETRVPRVAPRILVDRRRHTPTLDLVVIEPDEDRVTLTYRATVDVTGRLDDLPEVNIFELQLLPLGQRPRAA